MHCLFLDLLDPDIDMPQARTRRKQTCRTLSLSLLGLSKGMSKWIATFSDQGFRILFRRNAVLHRVLDYPDASRGDATQVLLSNASTT